MQYLCIRRYYVVVIGPPWEPAYLYFSPLLQPAMNTQNSKPRPPPTNARSQGKLGPKNKTLLETQHRLTTPLHTSWCSARFAESRGRFICSVRPRLPMSCMAVSIHVRWGCPMGLGWPGVECAKNSCLTMTPCGLRAA